jgi:UDP-N-acetylbacillosamine N-acetyltransferase
MEKIIIWGASGHAKVVADIIHICRIYEIAGFLDNINLERHGELFCESQIFCGSEYLDTMFRSGVRHAIVGFGDCEARLKLAQVVREKGFSLANAIHPQAIISRDVQIGAGTVIVAAAVVNPGTTIGENVIINTSASIDHDCLISSGVHICPGVHLGGGTSIGEGTWIGIGTIIKDHVKIGAHTLVGAGSLVLKDIPDNVVAYGSPAKIIRTYKA